MSSTKEEYWENKDKLIVLRKHLKPYSDRKTLRTGGSAFSGSRFRPGRGHPGHDPEGCADSWPPDPWVGIPGVKALGGSAGSPGSGSCVRASVKLRLRGLLYLLAALLLFSLDPGLCFRSERPPAPKMLPVASPQGAKRKRRV